MNITENASFIFIRHGETVWNNQALCQGSCDVELSLAGKSAVKLLAKQLIDKSFDTIVVSPLLRARQTAQLVQESFPETEIIVCDELAERKFGSLEGLPNKLMYAFEELESNDLINKFDGYTKLKVESWEQVFNRVTIAIDKILNYLAIKKILIVGHGRIFNVMCSVLKVEQIQQLGHNDIVKFTLLPNRVWQYNIINNLK